MIIEAILVIGFIGFQTYLEIRPLRANNLCWNYNNHKKFFSFVFALARAVVLSYDKPSIILVTVSLLVEIELYCMPGTFLLSRMNIV